MDIREIEQIRQKLIRLRSELQALEETSKEAREPVELDQTRVGRVSRMDAMQTQQMAHESARRRQRQLQDVEAALRRIESGKYGYCYKCEEDRYSSAFRHSPDDFEKQTVGLS